jgi:cytochrome c551/c552
MKGMLKGVSVAVVALGLSVGVVGSSGPGGSVQVQDRQAQPAPGAVMPAAQQNALVQKYCVVCHDDAQETGGVSLQNFDAAHPDQSVSARMVGMLKSGAMPPKDMDRPDSATLFAFMNALSAAAVGVPVASHEATPPPMPQATGAPEVIAFAHAGDRMTVAEQNKIVHTICIQCHTDQRKPGGISFEHFDVATAPAQAKIAEDMLAKLRAGMMPPQTAPKRPDTASIHAFVVSLEDQIDREAVHHADAGFRTFQRLNRVEYAETVRTLLGLPIDVSQWLPPDTMSHNFDNIADVQNFSPTALQSYLDAADEISRLAIGDPHAAAVATTYEANPTASQVDHVAGTPYGTRGGVSVVHVFPADGTYRFRVLLVGKTTGELYGSVVSGEKLEISVDGRSMAELPIDPKMHESLGPHGLSLEAPAIQVTAGPHQVSAAFLNRSDAANDDLMEPQAYTLADPNIGDAPGVTTLPHVRMMTMTGPFNVTGVSETVSRDRIFICRPTSAADETACATKIVAHLATEAYRRPVTPKDLQPLLGFYRESRQHGDFESGIRTALQAILASPDFLFRMEPEAVRAGQNIRISDLALASRLSYFLWATAPDATLIELAGAGELHEPAVLDAQVRRMLQDTRSYALSTRFAAQWLRLQDADKVRPDALMYPYYDATLAEAMKTETKEFFNSIVTKDASVLDLLTADYTYVNQNLAAFYGIPGVAGPQFRRVSLEGTHRRGLFGQGSIQVETSVADRSDPVLRGKWVLEVLLGQPPPPPPPNIPLLSATGAFTASGQPLSVRQRMEEHRKNPFCASCHRVIDPLGLAMENFDPTGHYRIKDNGVPVDASTVLYDGTKMEGMDGLVQAMMTHQDTFLRVFTENLMAYALGRQVEYYDMPAVRAIVQRGTLNGNRLSSYVLGIVHSDAFQMSRADVLSTDSQSQPSQKRH